MGRHGIYGVLILAILALALLGWALHQFLDGDVIKEVAGYLVKLTNGLFPAMAHNARRCPRQTRTRAARKPIGLPQHDAEATFLP